MGQEQFDTDVFVVGGGPAGLAAAIAARQQGFSVMVADSATPPIDKACGEGLMPDALLALRQLGLSVGSGEGGTFQGIKFIGPEGGVLARFPQGEGIGIRRTLLHQTLLEFASSLGVQTLWNTSVSGVQDADVRVGSGVIRTRWLIGADGQHSRVRNWAGLSAAREQAKRIGIRRHFQAAPLSDFVEIYWGAQGQVYVTPIGKKEICVALISRKKFPSFEAGIAQFPPLARHLANAQCTTRVRGSITASRRLKSVFRGRVALIGEASGSVDAITGEGLAMAFRQAVALGQALAAGDLSLYQAAHRQISSLPSFMAQSMLLMDRSPWVRQNALRAFTRKPALFERLLSVHVGELALRDFGIPGILNLGWQILVA
ncbi:MAG TPA: FAD-dependent monooxygenase [Candidatus Solibacter sp.]|jgi:flavin-dependent dehydrogenase|nr:FAD-dependent monooxygenase [Candidatus Solibacter sp.]